MPESIDTPIERFLKPKVTTELVLETREIGDAAIETVSGRRLHSFLENGDAFSNWIADRIRQYDFVEGVDFMTYLENAKKGRPSKEFAISLDMAKELSMVERNAKGKEARRYFIECERKAKVASAVAITPRGDLARECRLTQAMNMKMLSMMGITGNQAVIAASRGTKALTGIDPMALMNVTHIAAPQNEALLTPTDIARKAGLSSAQTVNRLLCSLGLQLAGRDANNHVFYEPTQAGVNAGGVMQDTGKRHSTGTPVRQLRWASSIVSVLQGPETRAA